MKTKKMILAIACVLMMVALTQSASAVNVAKVGVLEYGRGDLFTITFTHGSTETTETFHSSDIFVPSCIRDGDRVVLRYTNTLTTTFVTDENGDVHEVWVWVRTNMYIIRLKDASGRPSGVPTE